MGLISLTNIENNTPAMANGLNEKFSAIAAVLNGNIEAVNIKNASITAAKLATDVFQRIYPVGSVYINAQDNTDPATLLGFGTWTQFAAGRAFVGFDSEQTEFNAAEKTGGAKTHTLNAAEMPVHNHSGTTSAGGSHAHNFSGSNSDVVTNGRSVEWSDTVDVNAGTTSTNGEHSHSFTTSNAGSGAAHNNLQPYITVYAWKRTA